MAGIEEKKLVIIAGPTGVGKTAVAIKLAKALGAEIVSADSRQIFREMTIGTAKPSEEELREVKHHFINSHSITEHYDAARFGQEALALITRLFERHDRVVLAGGSGLYIKAVCEGFDDIPEVAENIRRELVNQYNSYGLEWLHSKMQELDPVYYQVIDRQNPQRIIRALEVRLGTGRSIMEFHKKDKKVHSFDLIKIGLDMDRRDLYNRIDERMDRMIADGLFDEAERLYAFRHHNALQTVGYQEIFDYMEGKYDRDEAIRLLKRNSRRYAKRQMTWFKRDENIRWFHPDLWEEILLLC